MDNMHYPRLVIFFFYYKLLAIFIKLSLFFKFRHQNCAIQILEQMECNGVLLDEDMVRLTIKVFGDWTHVVRKAKRQLYWLPKFKNANPYSLP